MNNHDKVLTINKRLAAKAKENHSNADIERANRYLRGESEDKPEWLDDFLNSNHEKMAEAVSRITSPDANDTSVTGYAQGYFNEIVQNANDLHSGDTISFDVSKSNETYKLQCRYADIGFSLSNIYGFLNRGMTDKGDEQTGKYGIGIKSLFCFVDSFEIRNNFCFTFCYDENREPYTNATLTGNNPGETELTITYRENECSVFSTQKLSDLIDSLCGNAPIDESAVFRAFIPKQGEEALFDARALIFLNLNSDLPSNGQNLRRMMFQGSSHWVEIECDSGGIPEPIETTGEIEESVNKWHVHKMTLTLRLGSGVPHQNAEDEYSRDYLAAYRGKYAAVFPLGTAEEEYSAPNRVFSTYFLKEDQMQNLFPVGAMFNSPHSNQQRTDLGDNEESIGLAYTEIKKKLISLYTTFCSEAIKTSSYKIEISDIFHHLLLRYLNASGYGENPLKMPELRTEHLPKMLNGDNRPFVVRHEENEEYTQASWVESNENPHIQADLTNLYFEEIESGRVYDLEDEVLHSETVIEGVRLVYEWLSENEGQDYYGQLQELSGYFPNVRDFLAYSVSGQRWEDIHSGHLLEDNEIDRWLIDHSDSLSEEAHEKHELLFLKLIGRYKLSDAIRYDGHIEDSNLSFYDYLFNEHQQRAGGPLSGRQEKQFKKRYGALKTGLLKNRIIDNGNTGKTHMVRYMIPVGPSARRGHDYDLYFNPVFHESFRMDSSQYLLLMEQMARDSFPYNRIRCHLGYILLFERDAHSWQCRESYYEHFVEREQQIICINMQNVVLNRFSDYLIALRFQNRIRADGLYQWQRRGEIADAIHVSCNQESLQVSEITQHILAKFVEKESGSNSDYSLLKDCRKDDVLIGKLEADLKNECEDEIRDFIKAVSGYDVYLHEFDSGTRKKITAYWCQGGLFLRQSASVPYRQIAKATSINASHNCLFVFYDNGSSIEAVSEAFTELGLARDTISWMNRYLPGGNITKTVSFGMWLCDRRRKTRKEYSQWRPITERDIGPTPSFETIYRLLAARGSYDNHCPICGNQFCGTAAVKKDKRPIGNALLKNTAEQGESSDIKYIPTIMCDACFNWLSESLRCAKLIDNRIVIETRAAHGQHEKRIARKEIPLSPVNLALIHGFKLGK